MKSRTCRLLTIVLASAPLWLAGCGGQQQPGRSDGSPGHPAFALRPVGGASPTQPSAPAVEALPAASSPLAVALDDGPERYRPVDQALAASEAFGETPPDYVVRYGGTPIWVWRAANGNIRAVERLADGARSYFYRALTEDPYLIAGPGAAYGYERGELSDAYDGDGLPLASMVASRRVVVAARLLDRGRALHAAIIHGERAPAHAVDWQAATDGIDGQRERWRQTLADQSDWRDWDDDQAGLRHDLWAGEQRQRLAYAAELRAAPPLPPRSPEEGKTNASPEIVAHAAPVEVPVTSAPATAAAPARPTAMAAAAAPAGAAVAISAASVGAAARPASAMTLVDQPRPARISRKAATAKTKRKAVKLRHRLHRGPRRPAARVDRAQPAPPPAVQGQPAQTEAAPAPPKRTPKVFRDIGRFLDRTFGVRVHRGSEAPQE